MSDVISEVMVFKVCVWRKISWMVKTKKGEELEKRVSASLLGHLSGLVF